MKIPGIPNNYIFLNINLKDNTVKCPKKVKDSEEGVDVFKECLELKKHVGVFKGKDIPKKHKGTYILISKNKIKDFDPKEEYEVYRTLETKCKFCFSLGGHGTGTNLYAYIPDEISCSYPIPFK